MNMKTDRKLDKRAQDLREQREKLRRKRNADKQVTREKSNTAIIQTVRKAIAAADADPKELFSELNKILIDEQNILEKLKVPTAPRKHK